MAIDGLSIIGETLNDSVPSTNALYEANDLDGVREVARFQESKGARYIDVNVGTRPAATMELMVQTVVEATNLPVSVDSPDYELARAGLRVCDPSRGKPILNSISPLRPEMFELYKETPFRPILLLTEFVDAQGWGAPVQTSDDAYSAARFLFERAKSIGIPNDDLIFDPGVSPIGSDMDGALARLMETLAKIQSDPEMKGVHASVGLSNFTVMLPSKRKVDGSPVKSPLESAFLTLAMPLGLDYVVGSVKRNYQKLDDDSLALQCARDCLTLKGVESLRRVRKFYR